MKRTVAWVAGMGTVGALVFGGGPSFGAEVDPNNGPSVLSRAIPGYEPTDFSETEVTVSSPSSSTTGPVITVTTAPTGSDPMAMAFSVGDSVELAGQSLGVTTLDAKRSPARYVSETPVGVQILTVFAAPQRLYESRTTFVLSAGEYPEKRPDGTYLIKSEDTVRGSIGVPWALDAKGKALPTSYRWEGSTLVQKVEVPADAAFPITADPNWSYTWTAEVRLGSPADVFTKLNNCFNCIFPVQGAPAAYPDYGQQLPLVVVPAPGFPAMNFACVMEGDSLVPPGGLYPNGEFGFWFSSDTGHIDGPGSMISFDWWTQAESDPWVKMRFTVYASIANASPGGAPQWAYLVGAKTNWAAFLGNYTQTLNPLPPNLSHQGVDWRWIN